MIQGLNKILNISLKVGTFIAKYINELAIEITLKSRRDSYTFNKNIIS